MLDGNVIQALIEKPQIAATTSVSVGVAGLSGWLGIINDILSVASVCVGLSVGLLALRKQLQTYDEHKKD